MVSAADYITGLQAQGRYAFTTEDAVAALGVSVVAARAALRRLKRKAVIADPYRGFHVVMPPAYRQLGCLPAEQFIPELMNHLGEVYYVGLLSAARYYGAAHQVPMVFQVIVPRSRRGLQCGGVRVEFIARQDMRATPIVERNTETGVIRVATPEATAIELVGYPEHCGYLNNVATVLAELTDSIRGESLAAEAHRAPLAWVQRLGFLLSSIVEADALASYLDPVLAERNAFTVPLAPWKEMSGAPRDVRWQVVVNVEVEPDR
jgi:predicted transcriptional regulator of viral defense system